MAFEWVAGLFQSEHTRGLSGDSAGSVALDDSNPYYNYRLRRHRADGDLVEDTGLLWYTSPMVKRRTGLGTHVAAEVGEGTANYTDVLLILSAEDWARIEAIPGWHEATREALLREFDSFCTREGLKRPHPHRPLGFKAICDGSEKMGGQRLGLQKGEFITGLLPNLYTGPVEGSRPVIGVHLNLPSAWEGYREVGRLHSDQILFTLGNHWLDNFSHPDLNEAALYRLQQYPDGSFVHIINPDLQDRYQVTSTDQGGASVLTLATRDGQPLAYIVLAVIDAAEAEAEPEPASSARPSAAPAPSRPRPRQPEIPSVAPPMMLDDDEDYSASRSARRSRLDGGGSLGGKTIIPDAPNERIFTLQERGALFQKVHFRAFMLGYDVYLGMNGELGTSVEEPAATFQVRRREVQLVAHIHGVTVDGQPLPSGEFTVLTGDRTIEVNGQRFDYRDLRGLEVDGWPYVAEVRRPASSTYMIWGEDYPIGRSRESRVVLPDETGNENIHWKPSVGAGATIRARTGEIKKSNFYTDSIMVASRHASVDLSQKLPRIVCHAKHCYVYIRRGGEVMPLYPTAKNREPIEMEVQPGDEVLIGNCVFHVGFTPADEAVAPRPAPRVELTADVLVDAVDPPSELDELDETVQSFLDPTPRPAALRQAPPPPPEDDTFDDALAGWTESAPPPAPEPEALSWPDPDTDDFPIFANDTAEFSPLAPEELIDATEPPPLPRATPPPAPRAAPPPVPSTPPSVSSVPPVDPSTPPPAPRATPPPVPSAPPVDPSTPPPAPRAEAPRAPTSQPPTAAGAPVVQFTDDADAQFELGRPMHLVQVGWMVNGEVVCGNHSGCELVLPENRIVPEQTFEPREYFRLQIRGRRGRLELLAPTELLIDEDDPTQEVYSDPEEHTIDVIRRDDRGDEDFAVRLTIGADRKLPDPRARLISIDTEDPLAAALITRGLPKGAPRRLTLDALQLTFTFDGERVRISDYLESYRRPEGFHPFFVQRGGARFRTAPEDGEAVELADGDRLVIGQSVYALRLE